MAEDFRILGEVMNRMFEDMLAGSRSGSFPLALPGSGITAKMNRQPFIDVIETDNEIVATAEMPGLKKEDIKINITDERLEISTESKHEEEKHGKDYLYKEIRSGSYYRSVMLPSSVDSNNAKASYNNGILEVKMPKTEIKKKTSIKIEQTLSLLISDCPIGEKYKKRYNMKLEIEIKAEHIDWKALVTKINEAIDEETTDISSVEISYSDCETEDQITKTEIKKKMPETRYNMKLGIEVEAENINRKELIAKINEVIDEETTDISSVEISYSDCENED